MNVKLDPYFICSAFLLVIRQAEETIIVYVCKLYKVATVDNLEFELNDRLEKVKLKLQIAGEVY